MATGDYVADQNSGYRVKATVLRAYTGYLQKEGLLADARASLSPHVLALLDHPPLPSSWVDGGPLSELLGFVFKRQGVSGVNRMSEQALREMLPIYMPALKAAMRLSGVSPATILAHLDTLTRTSIEGCEYRYEKVAPRSCTMTIHYPNAKLIPLYSFQSSIATFKTIFELCGVKGRIGEPQVINHNTASYTIEWA
jgi:hypothetical protein